MEYFEVNLPTKQERARNKARYSKKPNWNKCSLLFNGEYILKDLHIGICKAQKKRLEKLPEYKNYLHLLKIEITHY